MTDLERIYKRIGEIMERLDETLDRQKPRTAGADCYRSLAVLRADLRDSLAGSEYAPYGHPEPDIGCCVCPRPSCFMIVGDKATCFDCRKPQARGRKQS